MLIALLQQALAELTNLNSGEEFLVRDLFKGYIWNRIKRADRLKLGTMFLAQVPPGNPHNVGQVGKTTANQMKYVKL